MSFWGKGRFRVVLVMLAALLLFSAPAWAAEDVVDLQILSVNDFHGALLENGKNPGAAKLTAFLQEARLKNPLGTLLLSAGDMFQGSVESNLLYGKSVVEFMNATSFDAMALGNHEFDWGVAKLEERIAQSKFPYLGANVRLKQNGKTAPFAKEYIIIERKGVKIGVIGLATPQTSFMTNPKMIEAYEFADPVKTVERLLPQLKSEGAEIVIVLSHLGSYLEKDGVITNDAAKLASAKPEIGAIVSGHTHQTVYGKVKDVPIVQAYYFGRAVGEIDLVYDKKAKKMISSEVKVNALQPGALTPDAKVQAIVAKAVTEVAPVKQVVLGRTLRELHHDRSEQTVSLLGQWSCDVMREAADAQIAFQNGGGIRTSIPAGNINMGNLYEIMPFDNTLFTLEMSGAQVRQVLEYGIKNGKIGMLQYGGLKVSYDSARPEGKRIIAVTTSDGQTLSDEKSYRVVTNDFMAAGGDGYTMFKHGRNLKDSNLPLRDILVEKIKKLQVVDFVGDDRFEELDGTVVQKPAA